MILVTSYGINDRPLVKLSWSNIVNPLKDYEIETTIKKKKERNSKNM